MRTREACGGVVLLLLLAGVTQAALVTIDDTLYSNDFNGWVLEFVQHPDAPGQDISNLQFINEPPLSETPVATSLGNDIYSSSVLSDNGFGSNHMITIYFDQIIPAGQFVHIEAQFVNPDNVLVKVDSYALPEPASLLLLGLAGAGAIRSRRSW